MSLDFTMALYGTIEKEYEQQEYMYKNRTYSVADRIVGISQPWVRPIVRGKVKTSVEFGAKLDLSIDESGYGRIEKISFEIPTMSVAVWKMLQSATESAPGTIQ